MESLRLQVAQAINHDLPPSLRPTAPDLHRLRGGEGDDGMSEVKANRVAGYSEAKNAGDFYWSGNEKAEIESGKPGRLMFICPCGCGITAGITVKPVAPQGWDWNGDMDKPTTSPSILINQGHWHGYLTDGVFKSC